MAFSHSFYIQGELYIVGKQFCEKLLFMLLHEMIVDIVSYFYRNNLTMFFAYRDSRILLAIYQSSIISMIICYLEIFCMLVNRVVYLHICLSVSVF